MPPLTATMVKVIQKMRVGAGLIIRLLTAAGGTLCRAGDVLPGPPEPAFPVRPHPWVTQVIQFKTLTGADFLEGCDFQLTGVITLLDANHDLMVLQDSTGAVALSFPVGKLGLQSGQAVALDGTNCRPLFASFPDYPYRPSGQEIRASFESPQNWGEYNFTRMRGWLHPKVTGEYRFWIASDNSAELWLSTDANPSNLRKIASLQRYTWTDPHQWSKYPSQQSEAIALKAGETYYIEALQEQTVAGENLAVAWQKPAPAKPGIEVIGGSFISPGRQANPAAGDVTNGILREYWTNYTAGDLTGMGGARPYVSALTVKDLKVTGREPRAFPKPIQIDWNQPLTVENNWRWVAAKGLVKFKSLENNQARFEIFDGHSTVEVRALQWSKERSEAVKQLTNAILQVEGVCEGCDNQLGAILPERIWASSPGGITFYEAGPANEFTTPEDAATPATPTGNTAMPGFYGSRGVVTFNDRVGGKDYVFVQDRNSVLMVATTNGAMKNQLTVGHYVDLGGALQPGRHLQTITPLVVTGLGRHAMPAAMTYAPDTKAPDNEEGRWTQIEGVVQVANTNGTLLLNTKHGPVYLWLGQTPANVLAECVDAKVRARGVMLSDLRESPTLLVPSRSYLDVVEDAPANPFSLPIRAIASLAPTGVGTSGSHRIRVQGEITYQDENSFFVEDGSGGIRMQNRTQITVKLGEAADVVAFVTASGLANILTEPLVRPAKLVAAIRPKDLSLTDTPAAKQNSRLVQARATLLAQKTMGTEQILELQEQHRVFVAILATGRGRLPVLLPGSRLGIVGVCDDEITAASATGKPARQLPYSTSLNILLRSPQDVTWLSGPPWWTWEKTAMLVGVLLTISAGALLWVHLLRRRLERQQTAQLAFSRHVLGKLEEERRRIAVNLHDSLGQSLHVIKNHADLATQAPEEAQSVQIRLEAISSTAVQAIEDVRRITHGLRPYQLDRLGLTQSIRALLGQAAENRQISFASRIEEIDGWLDKDAEIHFYRMVQEAITNVTKHSAATEATVVIKLRATTVTLSVRDNGKGFDYPRLAEQPHEAGFGLTGISERARILKGTLTIDSKPQGGTSLTVEVPGKNPAIFSHEK